MDDQPKSVQRVVGFDCHPDSFTAAIIDGPTPAAAILQKVFNKIPLSQLEGWAQTHITSHDVVVLEASGNSFEVVRKFKRVGRTAKVLESCHLGKLKEAHANNDKISAVRIGKAYLAGTAKEVWVPDEKTQEWRDWFHSYRKSVRRATQVRNSLLSYLSDNGVRLPHGVSLTRDEATDKMLRGTRTWSDRQWRVIQGLLLQLDHAEQQRSYWSSLMAQEVLEDPTLLALVRICGIRDVTAFALGAFIGDINRFESPKKLVKYIGLNPAFDDSGEGKWSGGVGGHGNSHLRTLLVEGAQAVLRCSPHSPLAVWGKKLLARKQSLNLAVAAVARKMAVAVWYLMKGRWTPLEEIDTRLVGKVGKIVSRVGSVKELKERGIDRQAMREAAHQRLLTAKAAATATHVMPPSENAVVPEKAVINEDTGPVTARGGKKTTPKPRTYVLDRNKMYSQKRQTDSVPSASATVV